MVDFLYLHGFASSPISQKATYFRDRTAEIGLNLVIPDLNQGDFFNLSLTRQIQQCGVLLEESGAIGIIGSSFGGLTAAWLGEKYLQVKHLILLAPAFQFAQVWLPRLGDQYQQWREQGQLAVYHYGYEQQLPLSFRFVEDLQTYSEATLQRPIPTLICHGRHDETIPVQVSRDYAQTRPWVELIELDSDHTLMESLETLWHMMKPRLIQAIALAETP